MRCSWRWITPAVATAGYPPAVATAATAATNSATQAYVPPAVATATTAATNSAAQAYVPPAVAEDGLACPPTPYASVSKPPLAIISLDLAGQLHYQLVRLVTGTWLLQ